MGDKRRFVWDVGGNREGGTWEMRGNGFDMGDMLVDNQCDILLNNTFLKQFGAVVRKKKNYDNSFGIGYKGQTIHVTVWSIELPKNIF